jgi:hypothetical protein
MMMCPECGSLTLSATRPLTVLQTVTLVSLPNGNYDFEEDELGDTLEFGNWEGAYCECGWDGDAGAAITAFNAAHPAAEMPV